MNITSSDSQRPLTNIKALEYKSLGVMAADIIRKEIIEGTISPGMHITEIEIAEKLGVSRVVVREAIISLIQEGLLKKERNKYTEVVEFTKKDIAEIFNLRIAIEIAAAQECIEKKIDIVKILKEKIKTIDSMKKVTPNEIEDMVRSDLKLHEFIMVCADNKRLLDIWNGLSSQILVLLYKYVVNQENSYFESELFFNHDEILNAFSHSDKKYMEEVIREHIEDTRDFLLQTYNENDVEEKGNV